MNTLVVLLLSISIILISIVNIGQTEDIKELKQEVSTLQEKINDR